MEIEIADIPRALPEVKPRRRAGRLWLLIILLGLCSAAAFFSRLATMAAEGQEDWDREVDRYMRAMQARDFRRAYALFSAEARRDFPRSELEMLGQGPLYALFDGYAKIEISGWELNVQTDATYVELSGAVIYSSNYTGSFEAIIAKSGGEWQLLYVNVTVPPEKINAYADEFADDF